MSDIEKKILPLFEIPFVEGGRDVSGADCWGLVLLFYQVVLNQQLPTYENVILKLGDTREIKDQTFNKVRDILQDDMFEEIFKPKFGDIALVDLRGRPVHAGVVLGENRMIHTSKSTGVAIENYLEDKWKSRLKGFYRPKVA